MSGTFAAHNFYTTIKVFSNQFSFLPLVTTQFQSLYIEPALLLFHHFPGVYKQLHLVRGPSFKPVSLLKIFTTFILNSLLFSTKSFRKMGKKKSPFRCLVKSEEGIRNFRSKYRIPPTVGMRYAAQGEWVDTKQTGEVIIPMIAFIEGGMIIPMGSITRSYLSFFRLSPTQCAPNMFRVLESIDALNERMNLKLTHHDVNWVYNLHHLTGQGYYLRSRYLEVRLIQNLPTSNKNLKEDFFIFFGEWHSGLPCLMVEGVPGGSVVIDS